MLKFKHACLSLFLKKKTFWITLKASKIQPHKNFWQLENFVNHMSRMNFYIFIKSFGYVIWRIYYTRDYGLYICIYNIQYPNIISGKSRCRSKFLCYIWAATSNALCRGQRKGEPLLSSNKKSFYLFALVCFQFMSLRRPPASLST